MNPDKIRNVLNILFMVLALAAIHYIILLQKMTFKAVHLRLRARRYSSS